MILTDFPALYNSAGELSDTSQSNYLWSLRCEYLLLIVCSAMTINQVSISSYYYIYTFLFTLAFTLFIWRQVTKPEKIWYQGRALAESIKTLTWRFSMKATPFDVESSSKAIFEFQSQISAILQANVFAGNKLPASFASHDQVTPIMMSCRDKSLAERMCIYELERVRDQRNWYATKGGINKRIGRRWVLLCGFVYLTAIISSLIRSANPNLTFLPTEVLICIASSVVGWIQIKKFNELSASYILTAHEIGILHGSFQEIKSELEFSDFVTKAEQAFSREHTQWVARFA